MKHNKNHVVNDIIRYAKYDSIVPRLPPSLTTQKATISPADTDAKDDSDYY